MDMNVIKRIGKIIQTEATTTSIGDFLLTHVPFENLYLDADKKNAVSEEQLLNDIIQRSSIVIRETSKYSCSSCDWASRLLVNIISSPSTSTYIGFIP